MAGVTFPGTTVVFRLSSIGDILLASPLLRAIRAAAGPQARIDFVVKKQYAELVRSSHHLSVVHELDEDRGWRGLVELARELRRERYELAIDLHNNFRTVFLRSVIGSGDTVTVNKRVFPRWQLVHLKRNAYRDDVSVADRYLETVSRFGVVNDGKGLEVFIPDEIQFGISGRIARLRLDRFSTVVGLCPGARHFTKRWPAERFAELGVRLCGGLNAKVFIFGGAGERVACAPVAEAIERRTGKEAVCDFTGQLSLLETAAAMDYCDVVVTNDTGLMHLAAARQRRIVAVFGSTVREFGFVPQGPETRMVEIHGLECRPCSHIGRDRCPRGHFKCMDEIDVGTVHTAVLGVLGRS